jgi:hypothetical protein
VDSMDKNCSSAHVAGSSALQSPPLHEIPRGVLLMGSSDMVVV